MGYGILITTKKWSIIFWVFGFLGFLEFLELEIEINLPEHILV